MREADIARKGVFYGSEAEAIKLQEKELHFIRLVPEKLYQNL